ncbi:hypothetical protein, partial [Methylobacterium crusticola]|uniref:hypothetical protein n=1 Tax=Methylobacterium crusticola TaxID=1697972 RepID=UPI001EE1E584
MLFDQAVKRLENICLIDIEDKHAAVLDELRGLRNRIRHFAVETPESVAMSLITKTFSFAIEFVTDNLTNLQD